MANRRAVNVNLLAHSHHRQTIQRRIDVHQHITELAPTADRYRAKLISETANAISIRATANENKEWVSSAVKKGILQRTGRD